MSLANQRKKGVKRTYTHAARETVPHTDIIAIWESQMETLVNEKWTWHAMMADLSKAGLQGVVIDPRSVIPHSCNGTWDGIPFTVSWVKDTLLMVTMPSYTPELVEAFSKVVEYKPFCYYSRDGLITVEWSKNTQQTLTELRVNPAVRELTLLEPSQE